VNDTSPLKKTTLEVSQREVTYFEKNYPLHHAVLMDLIARKEVVITDKSEG
jgi:hypothetical protein